MNAIPFGVFKKSRNEVNLIRNEGAATAVFSVVFFFIPITANYN
jgi:hypothetical protein